MSSDDIRMRIESEMDVAIAVVQARKCAEKLGFRTELAMMIATAASELARNIVKYAGRGELKVRAVESDERTGIEVVAHDEGPGIADIDSAMQDHVSGGGTLGLGLPGVERIMDDFSIVSEPGKGTHIVAVKWH